MKAIAIVGMGCRFAGAPDLHSYWKLTVEGRDAFRPIPPDRWDAEVFHSESRRAVDKSYAPRGAFVDDLRSFPALALGLPPRRVEVMDPQQRLSLEVCLQAIEDAGAQPADMPHRTGVFMGLTAYEYKNIMGARVAAMMMASGHFGSPPDNPQAFADAVANVVPTRPYSAPGALGNMSAAAVAQELDLHGPAFTVDAACASAMVAVISAVQQLRSGDIDAALAGGAYANVSPDHFIAFSRIGAMSRSGQCLPFDERADGFVQGDGAGVVLLKRLEDAQRDGDRIYAVIEGAAYNNDGRGDGPMAPVAAGQAEVVRAAWANGDLDPARLGYLEAHGTGTSVGDQSEVTSLMDSIGARVHKAALGSSKANIGHTMSAAGIAGLIRAALAVHTRRIPPMANFESPKPGLGLEASPFYVPTDAEPWQADDRLAAISSFGFGGTNAHVVIGAGPEPPAVAEQPELVLMSAPTEEQLRDLAGRTADVLAHEPTATVAGVARAWARRRAQPARLGVVASTVDELIDKLRTVADGDYVQGTALAEADGTPKIAFLYPGQGSQRVGMLHAIRDRFPVVAETLQELEGELSDDLDVPLTHLLYPERRDEAPPEEQASAELTDTANCQPVLLSVAIALTRLLEQAGVTPEVVTGHSLGEFTAAAAAGVLSPADAARFVARRGRAMADLPGEHGAMAAIMAEESAVLEFLAEGAVIANVNHPRQVVVSGTERAIEQTVAAAEAAEIKAKRLQVSHGFHSPVLADLDAEPLLADLDLSDPRITVASGIDPEPYRDAAHARGVFARHATSPVRFTRALEQCREAGADLYLQVGAGGPLASFARGTLPRDHRGVLTLASIDDDQGASSLLVTLAQLWTLGVDLDVRAIAAEAPVASVPPAVLPRELYWAVTDRTQMALNLEGVDEARGRQATARVPQGVQEAPEPEPAPSAEGDDVADQVIAVVAKVSAYPRNAVKPSMTLVDDLGFDSLMVGDLATGLADAFPGMGGIPQELLINRPTVQDLIDHVAGADRSGGEPEADDDAPLTPYAVAWTEAALPDLPGRELAGQRVLITRDAAGLADALAEAFRAAGHDVTVVDDEAGATPCDLLVHCAGYAEHPPVGAVLAGETGWPDLAADLIAALDRQAAQGATPDVLVPIRAGDPWAGALAGVTRAVSREWPDALVKCIHLQRDAEDVPARLLAEWTGADRTPDVRLGAHREVAALRPIADDADEAAWSPSADETILITGGTRGIGALLGEHLAATGARILLLGRSEPGERAAATIAASEGRVAFVQADVTDRDALTEALATHAPITALVHCAGVLADGPLGEVDTSRGALARRVKVGGWLNAIAACGDSLDVALGVGSWAGRFGNRHQAHYAAANALLADLAAHAPRGVRAAVGEFGPWTSSEMASTIPAPVKAAMRARGVDFVGDEAGLAALLADLQHHEGPVVHGRDLPLTTRAARFEEVLSTETHPYLVDHAIQGTPVLPLAAATDQMARVADLGLPFEVEGVKLFRGVTVTEPTRLVATFRGDRAELRVGEQGALAYEATVRPLSDPPLDPGRTEGGEAGELSLQEFYDDVTFHGPLLQGIVSIDGVGEEFVRGIVKTGRPADWIEGAGREAFTVDPLALDSAMQLSAYVAWERFGRAGTPVGIDRYVQLAPLPEGTIVAEAWFGDREDDRFSASLYLRDAAGRLLAVAEGVVAELRAVERDDDDFEIQDEWVDPAKWEEVQDLEVRLEGATAMGIRNPYFAVHEGTARDTTTVAGDELVNFSSYNYLGLSGDPRVLEQVHAAVERYGTSVSASRVASGERPFHQELEAELAAAQGAEDALVYTAGHATNVTTIGHLMGPNDLILHDELIHDSILQGIKLSGAARRQFRHDDPEHLEQQLKELRRHYEKVLITIEGVYSMDGDICALPAYLDLKERHGCLLFIDEAHSFGVTGERGCGVGEHHGIDGSRVDLWMGTLSKSLASCGGWIAGSEKLITYLRYTAPGFVYSAGITPANGVAALASLRLMLAEPERVATLQSNAAFFQARLEAHDVDTGPARGESGVIPAVTGNSMHALMLSQRLVDQGINVQPIVYPAVADDAARLRFFLSSTHSEEQLGRTADRVAETLAGVREEFPV